MSFSGKTRTCLIALIAVVVFVLLVLGTYIFLALRNENIPGAGETDHAGAPLSYNGEKRKVRPYIHTVLLIGTDNFVDTEQAEKPFEAPYNSTQADFLALLVFDLKSHTVTPLQLNRDTMCDVPYLSFNGKVMGTVYEQLALSHNSGSGKEDSCRNVIRAVRNLLLEAPIDHYLSVSMDAVPIINDMVGGVTLTMDADYSDENGLVLHCGDVITLKGDEALHFVRMRRHDRVDVNEARMSRHRLYLDAFAVQARAAAEADPDLITDSYSQIEDYMISDMDLYSYSDFLNRLSQFEVLPVQTLQGVYQMGDEWAEFYPDPDLTWEIVKQIFT